MTILSKITLLALCVVNAYPMLYARKCVCKISESRLKQQRIQGRSIHSSEFHAVRLTHDNVVHRKQCDTLCQRDKSSFGFSHNARIQVLFQS